MEQVQEMVRDALIAYPNTRNSDNYLYYKVCEHIASAQGIVFKDIKADDFLLNRKNYGFPPFETVRRTRQKLQNIFPELKADDIVQRSRAEMVNIFLQYARS